MAEVSLIPQDHPQASISKSKQTQQNISGTFSCVQKFVSVFFTGKNYTAGQMFPFREIQTAAEIFIENIKRDLIDMI
jgi:hypothetical protein